MLLLQPVGGTFSPASRWLVVPAVTGLQVYVLVVPVRRPLMNALLVHVVPNERTSVFLVQAVQMTDLLCTI